MLTYRHRSHGTERAAHAAHEAVALQLRPVYHVRYENVAQFADDPFGWFIWVNELPELWATAPTEDAVVGAARATIADALDVPALAFDIETQPSVSREVSQASESTTRSVRRPDAPHPAEGP